MKVKIVFCILISIFFVACQSANASNTTSNVSILSSNLDSIQSKSEKPSSDIVSIGDDGVKRIDIKTLIGATNIFEIRMIDEENAFILGISDKQKTSADGYLTWENILAKMNINTGEVEEISRGYYLSDGRENMLVGNQHDYAEVVFNGQVIFYIDNNRLKDQRLLEVDKKKCAAYHASTDSLVYVDNSTLDLCLYHMENGKTITLFESVKNQNGEVLQMPSQPYISADGNKVLFQKVGETDFMYESIVGCDINGNVLFETDKLDRLSDIVYADWIPEGLFTMQTTDQSKDTQSGQATYFATYDQSGVSKKRFLLEGIIARIQRSSTNSTSLSFSMYELESVLKYALGVVNLQTGETNIVYHSNGIITSHDLSPSGEIIVWIEDHVVCSVLLKTLQQNTVDTQNW